MNGGKGGASIEASVSKPAGGVGGNRSPRPFYWRRTCTSGPAFLLDTIPLSLVAKGYGLCHRHRRRRPNLRVSHLEMGNLWDRRELRNTKVRRREYLLRLQLYIITSSGITVLNNVNIYILTREQQQYKSLEFSSKTTHTSCDIT